MGGTESHKFKSTLTSNSLQQWSATSDPQATSCLQRHWIHPTKPKGSPFAQACNRTKKLEGLRSWGEVMMVQMHLPSLCSSWWQCGWSFQLVGSCTHTAEVRRGREKQQHHGCCFQLLSPRLVPHQLEAPPLQPGRVESTGRSDSKGIASSCPDPMQLLTAQTWHRHRHLCSHMTE